MRPAHITGGNGAGSGIPKLTDPTLRSLAVAGLDPGRTAAVILDALTEDLGQRGDITSAATVDGQAWVTARYVARAAGVAAGLPVLAATLELGVGDDVRLDPAVVDGERISAGRALAEVRAPGRRLMAVERTSLNLLAHLCGVATTTRRWVDAVAGTGAVVRDTRKTTPGLRDLDKYAVRCGGGANHRKGLDEAYLVKDNHVAAAGGVGTALRLVQEATVHTPGPVQVEVDSLTQLVEALDHGALCVLLDNFGLAGLRQAVRLTRARRPSVTLEASGGLSLANARAVASTGVDFLAVGALTHSAPALDVGLDVVAAD